MDIAKALAISARSMEVQPARLRSIADGLANPDGCGPASPRTKAALRAPETAPAAARDMQPAPRGHGAGLAVVAAARATLIRTIGLLK